VDVQGRQNAALLLSSIDLPGDVRRRRTIQDQLQMRSFYIENDMISAECQQLQGDNSMSLHTRLKYGKLSYGLCVTVSPSLIRRTKTHFVTLDCGVDLIIGNNGYIWISPVQKKYEDDAEKITEDLNSETPPVSLEIRRNMARVRNSIMALSRTWIAIHPSTIKYVYNLSLKLEMEPKQMLMPTAIGLLTENAASAFSELN